MSAATVAHTPGLWRMDDSEESTEVLAKDGICVAQAIDPTVHGRSILSPAEVQANRRLIAAAPDLYEACRALVAAGQGEAWDDDDPDLIQGRAAIAKAEGRES